MKKITKKKIDEFIQRLIRDYTVFAPVETDEIVSFGTITKPEEIKLNYQNSKKPPKEIFFPQSEVMLKYRNGKVESTEKIEKKRILFGIRPCDAKAILLLDNVFNAPDYKDVYYTNKRGNTIIVGLGCNSPLSSCFCTSFGIGPFSTHGMDLLFIDAGEDYFVDVLTKKGEQILTEDFVAATDEELKLAEDIKDKAVKKIKSKAELKGVKEKLDGMFEVPFWDGLSEKCLGCGVCAYLCPTCHCFDIADEALNSEGRRVRNWDSCMFPLFTLEASGHNPRPTPKQRMRQRVMHKFNYFVENYKEPACVGCGRCITNCPVNIDVRGILKEITELKKRSF